MNNSKIVFKNREGGGGVWHSHRRTTGLVGLPRKPVQPGIRDVSQRTEVSPDWTSRSRELNDAKLSMTVPSAKRWKCLFSCISIELSTFNQDFDHLMTGRDSH